MCSGYEIKAKCCLQIIKRNLTIEEIFICPADFYILCYYSQFQSENDASLCVCCNIWKNFSKSLKNKIFWKSLNFSSDVAKA